MIPYLRCNIDSPYTTTIMQSIGERLEDARKRKGISLREASEVTKIRTDFLAYIEQNRFDFKLPEVYRRGFVKNYARYLKLDPDSILTDYNAHVLSRSVNGSKDGSELFGSMDVNAPLDDNGTEPSYGRISTASSTGKVDANTKEKDHAEEESDKIFYIKAGLTGVAVLALIFVMFSLIKALLSGGADPLLEVPTLDPAAAINETLESGVPLASPPSNETITLIASGNVYVLVKQRDDNRELFRKTLSAGETVNLSKNGPIDILFTAGEHLVVVNPAGGKLRPQGTGTAKISLP